AFAQPFGVEPVFVEAQTGRENVRDPLVQAGDEYATDAGFAHVRLRWLMAAGHLTRSAAILAGGQATRFGGRDKSRLLVDGHTILDRQLGALAPLIDDVMIIGDRDEALSGVSAPGL